MAHPKAISVLCFCRAHCIRRKRPPLVVLIVLMCIKVYKPRERTRQPCLPVAGLTRPYLLACGQSTDPERGEPTENKLQAHATGSWGDGCWPGCQQEALMRKAKRTVKESDAEERLNHAQDLPHQGELHHLVDEDAATLWSGGTWAQEIQWEAWPGSRRDCRLLEESPPRIIWSSSRPSKLPIHLPYWDHSIQLEARYCRVEQDVPCRAVPYSNLGGTDCVLWVELHRGTHQENNQVPRFSWCRKSKQLSGQNHHARGWKLRVSEP